jgi:uncharacterized membrane protein
MRTRWFVLLSALAAMVAVTSNAVAQQRAPEPAHLGFRVCNQTGSEIEVAKALNLSEQGKPQDIVSEGWYKLAASQCATLWPGKLKYRYYLLYAQNKAGGKEWKRDIPICVSRDSFSIRHGRCEANKYHRMFFQVDTGDEPNLFTYNFR